MLAFFYIWTLIQALHFAYANVNVWYYMWNLRIDSSNSTNSIKLFHIFHVWLKVCQLVMFHESKMIYTRYTNFKLFPKKMYFFKFNIIMKVCGLFSIDSGVLCLIYRDIGVFYGRLDFVEANHSVQNSWWKQISKIMEPALPFVCVCESMRFFFGSYANL